MKARDINMKSDRCPCGGIILADTEDWKVPMCACYYEDIGEPKTDPHVPLSEQER